MHAEVQIDDTVVMVSDGGEDNPSFPIWLHVYVPDVDTSYRRASTPVVSPSMSQNKGKAILTAGPGLKTRQAILGGVHPGQLRLVYKIVYL